MRQSKAKLLRQKAIEYITSRKMDIKNHRVVYQTFKKLYNQAPRNKRNALFA